MEAGRGVVVGRGGADVQWIIGVGKGHKGVLSWDRDSDNIIIVVSRLCCLKCGYWERN